MSPRATSAGIVPREVPRAAAARAAGERGVMSRKPAGRAVTEQLDALYADEATDSDPFLKAAAQLLFRRLR